MNIKFISNLEPSTQVCGKEMLVAIISSFPLSELIRLTDAISLQNLGTDTEGKL